MFAAASAAGQVQFNDVTQSAGVEYLAVGDEISIYVNGGTLEYRHNGGRRLHQRSRAAPSSRVTIIG
jgi:hypothetical protein